MKTVEWVSWAVFLLVSCALYAETSRHERIELKVSDTGQLEELLLNRSVDLMFQDGTYVKGRIKAISEREILLDVKASEGPGALSRGEQKVVTERISTVEMTRHKGLFRALLASVMGGVPAVAFVSAADQGTLELDTALTLTLTVVPAGVIGGYYLGRQMDRKTMTIVIRP